MNSSRTPRSPRSPRNKMNTVQSKGKKATKSKSSSLDYEIEYQKQIDEIENNRQKLENISRQLNRLRKRTKSLATLEAISDLEKEIGKLRLLGVIMERKKQLFTDMIDLEQDMKDQKISPSDEIILSDVMLKTISEMLKMGDKILEMV